MTYVAYNVYYNQSGVIEGMPLTNIFKLWNTVSTCELDHIDVTDIVYHQVNRGYTTNSS